jgi:hypothetical protein
LIDAQDSADQLFLQTGKSLVDESASADFTALFVIKTLADTAITSDLAGVFDGITYSYGLSRAHEVLALDQFKVEQINHILMV